MMKSLFKKKNKHIVTDDIVQKIPLMHRTSAKFTAFILVVLMTLIAFGSAVGATIMVEQELYTTPEWACKYDLMNHVAEQDLLTLINYITDKGIDNGETLASNYLSERNISSVELSFLDDSLNHWDYDGGTKDGQMQFSGTWYHLKDTVDGSDWYSQHRNYGKSTKEIGTVHAKIILSDEYIQQDTYFFIDRFISLIYTLRYWIYGIGIGAILIAIASFVFLLCASGKRDGMPTVQPGWGTKIPFDLLTGITALAGFLMIQIMVETNFYYGSDIEVALGFVLLGIALMVIFLGWCMSFATRIKLGGWWKNNLICYLSRSLYTAIRHLLHNILSLGKQIPLVWKTALVTAFLSTIELLLICGAYCELDVLLTFWFAKYLILIPMILYAALMLRKLQKGGEALAAGDLGYQLDTQKMFWHFKSHGENLNSIGEGMTAAVEQRLKSERMKTELITNVSHDIKTPLTSIINYTDFIRKEPCDNPAITEYAEVLYRQSDRLKRLIDDLLEASKASTGNLEVLLSPCEVGVLLTQTAGEYEQKLLKKGLILVTKQPEQPVKIMADGRHLWRVFDNLMNNICKYAQHDTRVYLTLEEKEGQAMVSFKNISHEALNLSAEELLERFVQGDSSRKSDGNGLGLSIAKSLTELQNGVMELSTDGDLFKVVLRFSTI